MKTRIDETNHMRKLMGLPLIVEQTEQVTIKGEQPYPNTDWDLVHGYFGSKRLEDDLEDRVGKKLKTGNYRVTYIEINSLYNEQTNKVETHGYVRLEKDENNPHKYFTTRGSIGSDFSGRHDQQVSGLDGRLKDYYKGEVDVFGPYEVTVKTPKGNINYKQSFFAITGNKNTQNTNTTSSKEITFSGVEDARNKLKSLPKDKWSKATISGNKITLDVGGNKEIGLSGIYDPDKNTLSQRISDLKNKYGYEPISDIVDNSGYSFVVIKTE